MADKDSLKEFFYIKEPAKKKRVNKKIAQLNELGYLVEKGSDGWEVTSKSDHSVTAIYPTLKEISITNPI